MRIYWLLVIMIVSGFALVSCQQQETDKINIKDFKEFPEDYNYDVYAGYLNITLFDKKFYYFLFKSKNLQEDDPVVLWLNGGPGCSSLMGMVGENGPFMFEHGKTSMKANNYTWNQNAHMLYLESPGGVGFSKAKLQVYNDTTTAQENYLALVRFFEKYASLKDNDFYIAGESYAGIYIPRLANQIINNNQQQSAQQRKINLKGILLGNPCTHPTQCYSAKYLSRYQAEFLYTRGFVDTVDYSHYRSACLDISETSEDCVNIQKKIHDNFYATSANVYNVYDVCYPLAKEAQQNDSQKPQNVFTMKQKPELGIFRHSLHCSDTVGSLYFFNLNEYRTKLHVYQLNDTLQWTPCSDTLKYTIESRAAYTYLPNLVKYGLKIWYFSGDYDAMVPIQGTISWLQRYRRDYGAAVKRNWRPWVWGQNKLGGMVWQLQGITFYSVIGAGHMVPTDQPEAALHIFNSFIGVNSDSEPEKELLQN